MYQIINIITGGKGNGFRESDEGGLIIFSLYI